MIVKLVENTMIDIRRDNLENWFDNYPWLTSHLENINSQIWFTGENPSLTGVKQVDQRFADKIEFLQ